MVDTQFVGKFRLIHLDYNDTALKVLTEKHAYEFAVGTTAPTDRQTQPTINIAESSIIKEDDKLALYMNLDTALTEHSTTGARAGWNFQIPITFKNERTGNKFKKVLVTGDLSTTGAEAPANSKVWAAGKWYLLGYYQVPAQSSIKLGHTIQDVRVDSKIILHAKQQTS
jgi:hypothetical protein